MRTRTITLVEFDSTERHALERIAPSVRIAFPMDEISEASQSGSSRQVKQAKQEYEGRWLWQVCRTKQEWDAKAIWGAWEAAVTLEAVLEAQSDRDYWERELKPTQPASEGNPIPAADAVGVVGLIAPGTDVCGMLAETRAGQLRDVREALPILMAARHKVGNKPEPREPLRSEGA